MQVKIKYTFLAGLLGILFSTSSWALLVAPDGAITENSTPFSGNPLLGTHYQQVYSSSLFSSAVSIDSLTFFAWSENTSISAGTYEFRLSTTSYAVNALDTVVQANNVGGDVVTFSIDYLSGDTYPELTITGDTFLYDPTQGNLLLEILVGPAGFSSGGFGGFQTGNGTFGELSSRTSNWVSGYESYGLVTEFGVTAVPVPAALLLFISGLSVLLCRPRKGAN
jgi:hypothetical protein